MNKNIKNWLVVLTCCLSLNTYSQEIVNLRIDPDNAQGGYASDYFDSIKFIPLETNKECLFGRIDQMEVTEKYFIILDQQTQSILFFYRNGKYRNKIQPQLPFFDFSYFSVNRSDSTISVIASTSAGQKILIYTFSGLILNTENIPLGIGGVRSLWRFEDGKVLYNVIRPVRLSPFNLERYDLVYSDGYTIIKRKLKPYNSKFVNQDYNSMNNFLNYSGEPGSIMFSMPYDYTIMQLNSKGLLRQFNFIFPQKYSLPQGFASDSVYSGKRGKYVYQTPENYGQIVHLANSYKLDNYLLFTTLSFGKANNESNFLYNLKSGKLISFDRITGDSSSSFLPVMSSKYLENLDAVYKGLFFTSISSSMLFYIKEHSEYNVASNAVLSQYYKVSNRKDNAVIIQYSLNKGL